MWDDVTPSMMSDEEPMPDGKIARNVHAGGEAARANSSFKQSARKDRILSEPIECPAPLNIKDWMKE